MLWIGLLCANAHAQTGDHMEVSVTVVPQDIRIMVTSTQIDFARQQAAAGVVLLDPATGEISTKLHGQHKLGVVQLTGGAGTHFAIDVVAPTALNGEHADIAFDVQWAQSPGCGGEAYSMINAKRSYVGQLGEVGQACLRFGGRIVLDNAHVGVYRGAVQVRLMTL